nr:hypothetical protein [Tanacetum cinerariifolium]
MLSDEIKASDDYVEYLAMSFGTKLVKTQGQGLLTKEGVEVVDERVNEPRDSFSSSSLTFEDEIKDISSAEENDGAYDKEKADDTKKADIADIAKITRKEPKPGKKRTRERKEYIREVSDLVLSDLPLHRSSSFDQFKVKSNREMLLLS